MNKHKRALRNIMMIIIPCLYLAWLPSEIVQYGMDNNIKAFSGGAPFHEVYSVFCTFWILTHVFVVGFIYSLYMFCYGCYK